MKTHTAEKKENIRNIIGDTALKSKEAVKEIISMNTKLLNQAMDNNRETMEEISRKFQPKGHNGHLYETWNKTFSKSVELSEDAIDRIIDAYSKQIQIFTDYNNKLIDAIYESGYATGGQNEKMLKLIRDNFETSVSVLTENVKELIESYNKHTNLALNFNKKFGDNINAQFQTFRDFQNNSTAYFTQWASDWWKHDGK